MEKWLSISKMKNARLRSGKRASSGKPETIGMLLFNLHLTI